MFELTPIVSVSRCPKLIHHGDISSKFDMFSDPKDDWITLQRTEAQKHGPIFVIIKMSGS
jgi:hypothetical protein